VYTYIWLLEILNVYVTYTYVLRCFNLFDIWKGFWNWNILEVKFHISLISVMCLLLDWTLWICFHIKNQKISKNKSNLHDTKNICPFNLLYIKQNKTRGSCANPVSPAQKSFKIVLLIFWEKNTNMFMISNNYKKIVSDDI
jgi:hypothetical protein